MPIKVFSDFSGYESDIDILGNLLEKITSNPPEGWNVNTSELERLEFLKVIFKIYASKQKRNYYKYGEAVTNKIINSVNPWISHNIAEIFSGFLENYERAQKEYAYLGLKTLITKNPTQMKISMPKLIPMISYDINDSGANVRKYSSEVLELFLGCSGNDDLKKFIPVVLKGLKQPDQIYSCVEELASCVFMRECRGSCACDYSANSFARFA